MMFQIISTEKNNSLAIELSQILSCPIVDNEDKNDNAQYIIQIINNNFSIYKNKENIIITNKYLCDLYLRRLEKNNIDRLLIRAFGKDIRNKNILDLTAGIAGDSLTPISMGAKISLIEKNPLIFFILKQNLIELERNINQKINYNLFNQDAYSFLENSKEKFDLIYLDPLFDKKANSKSKKYMQLLQSLGDKINIEELLPLALKKSNERVILKRPENYKYSKEMKLKPNHSIKGKIIRYDIFLPC